MKTRIAVVTCARSEYGLDRWIIRALRDDPSFVLQLVVGGAHLVGREQADRQRLKHRHPPSLPLVGDRASRAAGAPFRGAAEPAAAPW